MTPAALNVLTWALGAAVTVLLFALNRLLGKLDTRDAEIKLLTSANTDLKLAIIELKGATRVLDRTLSAIPTDVPERGGS